MTIVCRKCGRAKPASTYHRDSRSRNGRKARCAECTNAPQRERYNSDEAYRAHKQAQVRKRRGKE